MRKKVYLAFGIFFILLSFALRFTLEIPTYMVGVIWLIAWNFFLLWDRCRRKEKDGHIGNV